MMGRLEKLTFTSGIVHSRYKHAMSQVTDELRIELFGQNRSQSSIRMFRFKEKSNAPSPPVSRTKNPRALDLKHTLQFRCGNLGSEA
jgi:hypothetical protein